MILKEVMKMEMTLGERIRKARKGKMTQAELAHSLGVHEITIRRWELGERTPDVEDLKKISETLSVPLEEFLGIMTSDNEDKAIVHTRQQSKKEHSLNRGMLVFETQDGKRFEAPPTDIGMKYLERMLSLSMGNVMPAGV